MTTTATPKVKEMCSRDLVELDNEDCRKELTRRVTEGMDLHRHLTIPQLHALLFALTTVIDPAFIHQRAIRDLIITKASDPGIVPKEAK